LDLKELVKEYEVTVNTSADFRDEMRELNEKKAV
jgi:hypothetical protein